MEIKDLGYISIDFGTTKSLIAYATPTSQAEIRGECPTAVFFLDERNRKAETCELGLQALTTATSAWRNFTLDMGKNRVEFKRRLDPLPEGVLEPEPHFLAVLIFRELRRQLLLSLYGNEMVEPQEIERQFADVEIGPVTITVPAESDFRKRQATIYAARVAGFRDVQILEEPVAAYLYHAYKPNTELSLKRDKSITTLVIDFGGGTCDMAIVRKEAGSDVPVVLATKTVKHGDKIVDIGGNNIDEAIVKRWIATRRVDIDLGNENNPIPSDVRNCLLRDAVVAKLMMNPVPKDLTEKTEMLQKPMEKRRYGKVDRDPFPLVNGQELKTAELTPEDLDAVWCEFEEFIRRDLELLLGNVKPDCVILAGGSSYLRQYINFVIEELDLIGVKGDNISKHLLFDEPEKAIVMGALEHQRRGRKISSVLPMSVYLELDYEEKDIPLMKRKFCGLEFIRQQGKSYILLARKNDPVRNKGTKANRIKPRFRKFIPIMPNQQKLDWKIFQVRQTETGDQDYKNIGISSYLVYEIKYNLTSFPAADIINFRYDFDQYGDITIRIGPYLLPDFNWFTQWDSENFNNDFDWRQSDEVKRKRREYFKF